MIRIEVYVPSICDFRLIDNNNTLELEDETTLKEVLKMIKLPFIFRKISFIRVNSEKVANNYKLKDGDILSILTPVAGG